MTDASLSEGAALGERRWPVALTIAVAIALLLLIPDRLMLGAPWMLPVGVGVLLVAVTVADPGRIDRRSTVVRVLSIGVLLLLIVTVGWATERLIDELIRGGGITDSAG